MRILILHSRYVSAPISGENRVVDEEVDLLRRAGHDVQLLSPSPDDLSSVALAARTLGSVGVRRAVYDRVRSDGIEIVHCHNLYPALGAGVLTAASEAGAAVVITLHNYRFMCIASTFLRDGRVCQDCLGRPRWPGVVHACYRGSRAESALLSSALAIARARGTLGSAHRLLAVSSFVREKYIEAGFPGERILVRPNAVPAQERRRGPGEYFLVLSRLSVEKGVSQLVRAWHEDLGELRIVGDGPERAEIERLARGRGAHVEDGVPPDAIGPVLAGARAVLVPSVCFEGQPRTILEAYAAGVPVIASRIGGLPEVVVDGATGVTVRPGDPDGWRDAAIRMASDDVSERFGDAAYELWRSHFSQEQGLASLEAAYAEAIEERTARAGTRRLPARSA